MQMKIIEIQRFRNPWLWTFLSLVSLVFLYFGLRQVIWGIPFGDKPAPDWLLVFIMAVPFSILLLFACSSLRTAYNEEQLEMRYFPFLTKRFHFTDIQEIENITYSPFFDYGGWGIKWNMDGWAYIVSGNQGLSLKMKNGKKYLIGIQDPEKYKGILKAI
jgi:hypothetical protein